MTVLGIAGIIGVIWLIICVVVAVRGGRNIPRYEDLWPTGPESESVYLSPAASLTPSNGENNATAE